MNIRIEVEKILMKELKLSEAPDINANLVDDLGADSVDHLEIAFALEEQFDVEISEDELHEIKTVRDVVEGITRKIFPRGEGNEETNLVEHFSSDDGDAGTGEAE